MQQIIKVYNKLTGVYYGSITPAGEIIEDVYANKLFGFKLNKLILDDYNVSRNELKRVKADKPLFKDIIYYDGKYGTSMVKLKFMI